MMEFNSVPRPPLIRNPFPPNNLSAVQGLVARLCGEIGFATNIQVHQIKSGNKCNIIFFTCLMTRLGIGPSDQRNYCVLRTSKFKHRTYNRQDLEMQRLVAFHHNSEKALPVPIILAWDETYYNCIRCSYMIQQQVSGQTLSEYYRRLNNLHNKYQRPEAEEAEDYAILGLTVSALIENQEQAYASRLAHYGTFQVSAGMALKSSDPWPDRILDIDLDLDRIQLHVKPFAQGAIAMHMQTNTKVIDFILELLTGQETQVRTALHENRYRKILDIALCLKILEDDHHPAHRTEPSILWHPDFHPRKILITQQRFLGDNPMNPLATTFRAPHSNMGYSSGTVSILGWEGALALPRILTRCPPSFLWEECPQISAGCREKAIKVRFDTLIERKLPGYCADAYGEVERMIRAVGMYAVLGFDVGWKELSFEGLMRAWERYVAGLLVVGAGRWHRGEYLWGR